MDDEWKTERLQALIDQEALVEDSDGILWLGDKMRAVVKDFHNNERIKSLIKEESKNEDDYLTGCWSYLYVKYVGDKGCSAEELSEAVTVLKGWNAGAEHTRMEEWSMRLRLR